MHPVLKRQSGLHAFEYQRKAQLAPCGFNSHDLPLMMQRMFHGDTRNNLQKLPGHIPSLNAGDEN